MEVILDGNGADLLATAEPAEVAEGYDAVIAVPLPALAMKWPGDLPAGVIDYAAEVRSHGDVFMAHEDPDPEQPAVRNSSGAAVRHAELLDSFAAGHEAGARLLVRANDGLEAALANALGAWKNDGSVVLVHGDVELTDKLLADERVHGD
jgi:uncharacterized protein (TIGR03089 family)